MTVFSEIVEKYGDPAVLYEAAGEKEIKTFIQPILTGHDKPWLRMTNLGEADTSRYWYFGPADAEITDTKGTYISCLGRTFDFIKAEPFRIQGVVSHWEGILKIREETYDG